MFASLKFYYVKAVELPKLAFRAFFMPGCKHRNMRRANPVDLLNGTSKPSL